MKHLSKKSFSKKPRFYATLASLFFVLSVVLIFFFLVQAQKERSVRQQQVAQAFVGNSAFLLSSRPYLLSLSEAVTSEGRLELELLYIESEAAYLPSDSKLQHLSTNLVHPKSSSSSYLTLDRISLLEMERPKGWIQRGNSTKKAVEQEFSAGTLWFDRLTQKVLLENEVEWYYAPQDLTVNSEAFLYRVAEQQGETLVQRGPALGSSRQGRFRADQLLLDVNSDSYALKGEVESYLW